MFIFYTFACFIRSLMDNWNVQPYQEKIINSLFKAYIGDKNYNDSYYLQPETVSKVMKNSINLPNFVKGITSDEDYDTKIYSAMYNFILENINSIDELIEDLKSTILEAENVNKSDKGNIKNLKIENEEDKINFICEAFRIALKNDNKLKIDHNLIWRGKNSVNAIIGDLFSYGFNKRRECKNIVVIPVDTSFETHITTKLEKEKYPLVSEKTIHGKFLSRMYKITVKKEPLLKNDTETKRKRCYTEEGIKNLIENNLKEQGIEPSGNNSKNKPLYPIGTIAVIYHLNTIFYLLAISEFDENNNAQSNEKNIKIAIENLLEFYDKKGQGYSLYLPLIGTGFSRVRSSTEKISKMSKMSPSIVCLSPKESFECILSTIMEKTDKILGEINIVIWKEIHPEHLEEINLFLNTLRKSEKLK